MRSQSILPKRNLVDLALMNFNNRIGNVILSAAKDLARHAEILRCAQDDRSMPVLIGKIHQPLLADLHLPNTMKNSEIKTREAWHSPRPQRLRRATPPAERSSVRSCG